MMAIIGKIQWTSKQGQGRILVYSILCIVTLISLSGRRMDSDLMMFLLNNAWMVIKIMNNDDAFSD